MEAAARDPGALEAWQHYHLIGDVLRSSELAAGTPPGVFLRRLQSRLQHEPPLVPAMRGQAPDVVMRAVVPRQSASNDASFRWKVVAGFACATAATAIAWSTVGGFAGRPEQAQLAALPAVNVPVASIPAANGSGPMIRDSRLDEFLAAHRQLGGASALQTPAGFLRNAAFEGGSR
jgi:sigma-E factor negative regulatory protein RseA